MSAPIAKIGRAAPDPDVIAVIEDLLEWAQAGEIRSIVYAATNADGTYTTGFETINFIKTLNLCAAMQHNLAAHQREQAHD